MDPIHIPEREQDQVRVFAINQMPSRISGGIKQSGKHRIAETLLGQPITENGFELFPIADLTGVGLAGYLSQGYDVPADQLTRARARLDALDGYVMLVFSGAFDGRETYLAPSSDLTLIGTFGEAQANMQGASLSSAAAQPYSGNPRQTSSPPPQGKSRGARLIVALFVLAGLALWWALR